MFQFYVEHISERVLSRKEGSWKQHHKEPLKNKTHSCFDFFPHINSFRTFLSSRRIIAKQGFSLISGEIQTDEEEWNGHESIELFATTKFLSDYFLMRGRVGVKTKSRTGADFGVWNFFIPNRRTK